MHLPHQCCLHWGGDNDSGSTSVIIMVMLSKKYLQGALTKTFIQSRKVTSEVHLYAITVSNHRSHKTLAKSMWWGALVHFLPSPPYMRWLCLRRLGWWIYGRFRKGGIFGIRASLGTFNNWELDIVETFFSKLLEKVVRREENNKVIWKDSKKGVFSIYSFYSALELGGPIPFPTNIIWNPWVLSRASFFSWEVSCGKFWLQINFKKEGRN